MEKTNKQILMRTVSNCKESQEMLLEESAVLTSIAILVKRCRFLRYKRSFVEDTMNTSAMPPTTTATAF